MLIHSGARSLLLGVNQLAALGLKESYGLASDHYPTDPTAAPGLLPTAVLTSYGSPAPGGSLPACQVTGYHLWPGLPRSLPCGG